MTISQPKKSIINKNKSVFPSFSIAYEIISIVFYLVFIQKNDKSFSIVKTYFSFSPNKGLDGGAHHAGKQEEWGDQDVKEGQRGKGHSWGQISVLGDVNMNHKRLRNEREHRMKED